MPRVDLIDLWTNTCGLLLIAVAHASCAMKCDKCEEGKAYYYVERVQGCECGLTYTEREDMVISQDDHPLYLVS